MGRYDLKGLLRVIGIPELMNLLQSSQKSGLLKIHSGVHDSEIVFREGEVALIFSLNTNWNLLKLIRDRTLITASELETIEPLCNDVSQYVGLLLLQRGVLDAGTVIELTKELIPMEMAELLKLRDGEFEFHEGEANESMPLPVNLPVPFVIFAAAQRLDEIRRGELQAAFQKGTDIRPRAGKLVQIMGDKVINNYTLRLGSNLLGSSGETLIKLFGDDSIRARHARIYLTGLNYYIDNLAESASIRVNGIPTNRQQLFDGDEIEIGKYRFLFHRMVMDRR